MIRWLAYHWYRRRCTYEHPCSALNATPEAKNWAAYATVMCNVFEVVGTEPVHAAQCARGHRVTTPHLRIIALRAADRVRYRAGIEADRAYHLEERT